MSDLSKSAAWNRARALKLHEHFQSIAMAVQGGARVGMELRRVVRILDGLMLPSTDGPWPLVMTFKTLEREWGNWNRGGRTGKENPENRRKSEALLCQYKAGCGGHTAIPRKLVQELHRRMTLTTGGRDKHGKSAISAAWGTIKNDFAARRPLPGIDYADYEPGAELPWHYTTACRHKAGKGVRQLGNRGAAAHKGVSACVNLNYSNLRRGELYTLDDVRLDIVVIDEATAKATEVVLYVFMEVGSRSIVGYVLKPSANIKQEDVDELLSHMLQVPGYGVGVGYVTHILFERGTTACSPAAQAVLEGITEGGIKVHRTGMVGGVRWIGGAKDKAKGNSAGKAVIERFNRTLHEMLLSLPGQRGMSWDQAPQNLGALGGAGFYEKSAGGKKRTDKGTFIDESERLAQMQKASGGRIQVKLPGLYLMQLDACVADAIRRYNAEPGHEYRGHGQHYEAETAPGVWTDTGVNVAKVARSFPYAEPAHQDKAEPPEQPAQAPCEPVAAPAQAPAKKRVYKLKAEASPQSRRERYFHQWRAVEALKPGLDRFALTRRTLGHVPEIAAMSEAEFAKMLDVFKAIVRDAK